MSSIQVIITTATGKVYKGDIVSDYQQSDVDGYMRMLGDFTKLASLNLTVKGDRVFLNPAHVESVKIVKGR